MNSHRDIFYVIHKQDMGALKQQIKGNPKIMAEEKIRGDYWEYVRNKNSTRKNSKVLE